MKLNEMTQKYIMGSEIIRKYIWGRENTLWGVKLHYGGAK